MIEDNDAIISTCSPDTLSPNETDLELKDSPNSITSPSTIAFYPPAKFTLPPPKSIKHCPYPACKKSFTQNYEYKYLSPSLLFSSPLSHPHLSLSPTSDIPHSKHLKAHTRPHRCPTCNVGFEYKKDAERHHNDIHDTKTSFLCVFETCKRARGKAFTRKENWRRHLRKVHGFGGEF